MYFDFFYPPFLPVAKTKLINELFVHLMPVNMYIFNASPFHVIKITTEELFLFQAIQYDELKI